MVYAMIGPNGGLVPVVDHDKHIMEAASELGRIEWDEYLAKGHWNDTHDESTIVGHGSNLEFHDQHTEMALAHRKVGFWTNGHLWDGDDPESWRAYGDHTPSATELRKADRFWGLATALRGASRPLGFSAHGMMLISPCRSRVLQAQCRQAAVCELPKNPASTAEAMMLALADSPLVFMRKGMVARHDRPCGKCACPPGAACLAMRKGDDERPTLITDPSEIDAEALASIDWDDPSAKLEALVALIRRRYFVSREDALRWVRTYLARDEQTERRP